MMPKLSRFSTLVAVAALAAGCGAQARVTGRSLHTVTTGGPAEAWIVMGETHADVVQDGVVLNKDLYVVYHCIPQGCKRVSELAGTEVRKP